MNDFILYVLTYSFKEKPIIVAESICMLPDESPNRTLADYKALEASLHRDLMNVCRRYIHEIGIVSIMGMLDIVKQEAAELERATRKMVEEKSSEEFPSEENEFSSSEQSSNISRF